MNDICCIGHITLDKIITPNNIIYLPGGTSYYFSHGISHLDDYKNYKLVTSLAETEMSSVEEIRKKGIKVKVIPSSKTVYFENKYGTNQDNRTQRVLAKADPFNVEDLKDVEARIYHLGSLLSNDFSLDIIKYLSGRGILSLDVQGYLREVRGDKVYSVDWPEKLEALKYIDILKINEFEMELLTGYSDPIDAAKQIGDWGVKEVLVTLGSLGSIIYADKHIYKIPAYPPKRIIDATGCGDTYATGYLYMRNKGASYEEAGCFAAAMASISQEVHGPFSGTEQDILHMVKCSNLRPEKL
ncbi:PfkB family carbohydrate kinase [Phocaeicola oris]|uniref:PfkB family carbohydrate kinase n=1 Tax=Phocaeicola oris TaxID=2896850 RepID=UPI00234EDE82|nr:PfkB family carbohydrate kinase [Phocaeicola oris]MCE2617565.1 PfkB family carbohydrate kinase [Phocaeicola oris]